MLIKNTLYSFSFLCLSATLLKVIFLLTSGYNDTFILTLDGLYALIYGTKFDATIAAILTVPVFLFSIVFTIAKYDMKSFIKCVISIAFLWITLTTTSDTIYTLDSGKHVTFELFTSQGMEKELIITAFKSYWSTILISFIYSIAGLLFIWFYFQLNNKTKQSFLSNVLFILGWLILSITVIRGGWNDAPQTPMRAYNIGNNEQAFVAWSPSYSITYYLFNNERAVVKKLTIAPTKEQLNLWQQLQQQRSPSKLNNLKQANIVLVLLESWPAIDMQSYAHNVDATPFFDSLRKHSLSTHSSYADGYRTVQGMFATLCSYPNPIDGIISTNQLQTSKYICLPHILKKRGWSTTFIQGSAQGKVGSFAQTLGFNQSFGKHDYSFEGTHNEWGYMDKSIYKFSLDQIDKMTNKSSKPFLITINTGTTHGSYLPKNDDYSFGYDTPINLRRSVLKYADNSLETFIPQLNKKLKSLDKPSIVVLMADHTAKTKKGGFTKNSIPFLIYSTDDSIPEKSLSITASQRDIGATILDWLGGYVPWFTGNSLLDKNYKGRASFSFGSGFFWLTKEHGIAINVRTGELAQCFEIGEDTVTKNIIKCDRPWVEELFNEASYYNSISQKLLFEGKTTSFIKNSIAN